MPLLFCFLQKDVQSQNEVGLKKFFFNAALYPKIKCNAYNQDAYRFKNSHHTKMKKLLSQNQLRKFQ